MANILINEDKTVKGKLTITRTLDESQNPPAIIVQGILSTHRYFEEIYELETERYLVEDVNVYQESFGSDDFNIVYYFYAGKLHIANNESPLSDEEIDRIETKLYGGETNEWRKE